MRSWPQTEIATVPNRRFEGTRTEASRKPLDPCAIRQTGALTIAGLMRRPVLDALHNDGRLATSSTDYRLRCCVDPLRPPWDTYARRRNPENQQVRTRPRPTSGYQ